MKRDKDVYRIADFLDDAPYLFINSLYERINELQTRIDKAIEYVNSNHLYEYVYDKEEFFEIVSDDRATNELLEILKGE